MPGPDDAKVAAVEGGDLRFVEALSDGDDGGVDEAEIEVRVGATDLRDAVIIAGIQVLDVERASRYVIEKRQMDLRFKVATDEVIDFHKDWRRDY
jgi:hypothetical protein